MWVMSLTRMPNRPSGYLRNWNGCANFIQSFSSPRFLWWTVSDPLAKIQYWKLICTFLYAVLHGTPWLDARSYMCNLSADITAVFKNVDAARSNKKFTTYMQKLRWAISCSNLHQIEWFLVLWDQASYPQVQVAFASRLSAAYKW